MSAPPEDQHNPISFGDDLDDIDKALLALDGAYEEDEAGWNVNDVVLFPDLDSQDAVINDGTGPVPIFEVPDIDSVSSRPSAANTTKQDTPAPRVPLAQPSGRPEAPAHMAHYYSSTPALAAPATVQPRPDTYPRRPIRPRASRPPRRSKCPRCDADAQLVSLQTGYYQRIQCSSDCLLGLGKDGQGAYINQMKRNFPGFENPRGYAFEHAYLTKKQINEIMDEEPELFAPRKKRSRTKLPDVSNSSENLKDEDEDGEKGSSPSSAASPLRPPNDFKEDEEGEERQVEDR